ncbi:MAG: hypothetical protein IPL71_23295 [Anaerolineales bacterium]|uniref:hypothetical protein n=1 Tax=Candidatus Villigracilis proximus TaxID=3140683 RepID=UPI0031367D2F|nr:hypothetical protein [Anaerolineales bacterium]
MKFSLSIIFRVAASVLIGSSFAFAFAFPYFSDQAYTLLDKFSLVAVPAFALIFIVYSLLNKIKRVEISSLPLMFGLAFLRR